MREIRPINNNGSIQLKFTVGGKRYSFNPIPGGSYGNRKDMAEATLVATKIQNDIQAGYFDETLERYRPSSKLVKKPGLETTDLLGLWDAWVDTLDISAATKADHYKAIRRMIVKASPAVTDTSWLTKANLAPNTYNKRLSYVKSCFLWAVREGKVTDNPFEKVKTRKVVTKPIKPFTREEIATILKGFDEIAPHYKPFIKFLFLTGTRLAEAIGLRWEHVDFARNEIVIRESYPKDRTKAGRTRIRKETKTGSVRYLTMGDSLRELLESLRDGQSQDDLVFKTVRGCVPDNSTLQKLWKKVLRHCGIPYRKLHAIRHTMLSHAVEQGIPLTGVAYLAGHSNTSMVIKTYGHMVNRPNLPDMGM